MIVEWTSGFRKRFGDFAKTMEVSSLLPIQTSLVPSSSCGRISGITLFSAKYSRSSFRTKNRYTISKAFAPSVFSCRAGDFSGGFLNEGGFNFPEEEEIEKWDSAKYEALLKGGDQVTSVLEEMVKLVRLCMQ